MKSCSILSYAANETCYIKSAAYHTRIIDDKQIGEVIE